jgi:hypothetical protein
MKLHEPWVEAGVAAGLFLGVLLALEFGRHFGRRRLAEDPEGARTGLGAIEGSVFGLLGLLIAFTFQGAANRFDARRDLIVQEANAIGTAWLRLDVLPAGQQPPLRALLRRYLDSRLAVYRDVGDEGGTRAALAESAAVQRELWLAATAATQSSEGRPALMAVLPPLNEMFDLVTTRSMALLNHPPGVIFALLVAFGLGSGLLGGYAMAGGRRRGHLHQFAFAAMLALCLFVILDLEYPRTGLIRVDAADRVLLELRQGME